MDNTLLVRIYDVGFGDCIYVRVPDANNYYHILIDCGSKGAEYTLRNALDNVRSMLDNQQAPKKRLDLLIVTHPHNDHIKGFDPEWFKGIRINHIWLSAFMKRDHPQAKQAHALQALADKAARSLQARGLKLSASLDTLIVNTVWNDEAMETLRTTLPRANRIKPLYVSRDIADPSATKKRLTAKQRREHKVSFKYGVTCFQDFQEKDTCLRILAPEWDIDGYYLGKTSCDYLSLVNMYNSLLFEDMKTPGEKRPIPQPCNISKSDFRRLHNRILYSALAFSREDHKLKNNTCVVFLLEWRGKRLLFTGDAEWTGRPVKKGRRNGCWDVMLLMDKKHGHLGKPLDFLKVAHHGSVNGTPFIDKENAKQTILDNILPRGRKAQIVVSTRAGETRSVHKEVPYRLLMQNLGLRAVNAREYGDERGILQPQRTDKENEPWIDISVKPNPRWKLSDNSKKRKV